MVVLYILNTILLIVAVLAISMQFFLAHKQREMNDMNSVILSINKLFKEGRIFFRDENNRARYFNVHSGMNENKEPVLYIDIINNEYADRKQDDVA